MKRMTIASITIGAVLCALVALPSASFGQQEGQSVEGALITLDLENETLTIQVSDDMQMTFAYNAQTEVQGAEAGIQGLGGQTGTEVRVTYTPPQLASDAPLARQIVVLGE